MASPTDPLFEFSFGSYDVDAFGSSASILRQIDSSVAQSFYTALHLSEESLKNIRNLQFLEEPPEFFSERFFMLIHASFHMLETLHVELQNSNAKVYDLQRNLNFLSELSHTVQQDNSSLIEHNRELNSKFEEANKQLKTALRQRDSLQVQANGLHDWVDYLHAHYEAVTLGGHRYQIFDLSSDEGVNSYGLSNDSNNEMEPTPPEYSPPAYSGHSHGPVQTNNDETTDDDDKETDYYFNKRQNAEPMELQTEVQSGDSSEVQSGDSSEVQSGTSVLSALTVD